MDNEQGPTVYTGNSAQCYVAAWMGEGLGENGHKYMYGWITFLSTQNYYHIVNRPHSSIK